MTWTHDAGVWDKGNWGLPTFFTRTLGTMPHAVLYSLLGQERLSPLEGEWVTPYQPKGMGTSSVLREETPLTQITLPLN